MNMNISNLLLRVAFLLYCFVTFSVGSSEIKNENKELLKRLENLETKQRNDGVRINLLETHVHRQTSFIQDLEQKILHLEETVSQQKSRTDHIIQNARRNRRQISFLRNVLYKNHLLDYKRTIPRSQSHKLVASSSRQQQQHHKNRDQKSNHIQTQHHLNSDRKNNNQRSHQQQKQASHKHNRNRINSKFEMQSNKSHHNHHRKNNLNPTAKGHQEKGHRKHSNVENGQVSRNQTSADRPHSLIENQETRHAVPDKPRRSLQTTRQAFGGIAFSVYLDHDATLSQHEHVKFNKILTNDGGGYDPLTGVFTCAEGGVYMFTFSVGQRDENHYMWAELMLNNQNVIDAVVDTYHQYQDLQGGNTVIVRLRQGDRVWVDATHNGSHIEGSGTLRLTTFSGLYLYA